MPVVAFGSPEAGAAVFVVSAGAGSLLVSVEAVGWVAAFALLSPPEVTTAIETAASTSTAVTPMTARC